MGAWNNQTHVSPFQFGGEIAKHPCLMHLDIVHPMSGHFKCTEVARHPCLLIWGVCPFRYTGEVSRDAETYVQCCRRQREGVACFRCVTFLHRKKLKFPAQKRRKNQLHFSTLFTAVQLVKKTPRDFNFHCRHKSFMGQ